MVREILEVFEIMKINVIKEIEETELKSSKLEIKIIIIVRMKESLGEFEMNIFKNEIKVSEKIARKKERNQWGNMIVSEIKIRARSKLEKLEIGRINKIKELRLCLYY